MLAASAQLDGFVTDLSAFFCWFKSLSPDAHFEKETATAANQDANTLLISQLSVKGSKQQK